MSPDAPNVADLFDRIADSYDRVGVEMFKPIAARLVDELDPREGEHALDIGCGRGAVTIPLARRVGVRGSVTGIDVSPRMVEATRAEAAAAGVTVDARVGDAQAPDLAGQTFDLVASSLVLFFLRDPAAALRAWRDLLAPGGRVGVTTFGAYSESWREVDAVLRPYQPKRLNDPRTQGSDSPFASDQGMESLLADAGFVDVRTATMEVSVRFDDAAHWERWTMSVGQRAMWEAIPAGERDAVRAEAHARLDLTKDAAGRIGFDQTVRITLGRRT